MVPRFQPHHTARIADRLLNGRRTGSELGLLACWVGKDLSFDLSAQSEFIAHVRRLLGFPVQEEVLRNSCAGVFGTTIDPARLMFWCWRIAANRDRLKAGRDVPGWHGLLCDQYAPVQIVHAKPGRSFKDYLGVILTFRVIDGFACPVEFERWFPQRFLWILARELGLNTWRDRPGKFLGIGEQLVGMRLTVLLTPRDSRSREPSTDITFDRYQGNQFRTHNRQLARERTKPCPAGYHRLCHKCPLGLDQCPTNRPDSIARACRPVTLELLGCVRCRKDTWHDAGKCIECRRAYPPRVRTVSSTGVMPRTFMAP